VESDSVLSDESESHDQASHELELRELQAAIDEGDASGLAAGDVFAQVRKKAVTGARN
jgi:hypothetical protein